MSVLEHDQQAWYDLAFDAANAILSVRVPRGVVAFVVRTISANPSTTTFPSHCRRPAHFINMGSAAWGYDMVASQSATPNDCTWSFSLPRVRLYAEDNQIKDSGLRSATYILATLGLLLDALNRYEGEERFYDRPQLATVDAIDLRDGSPLKATLSPAVGGWLSRLTQEQPLEASGLAMRAAHARMIGESVKPDECGGLAAPPNRLSLTANTDCLLATDPAYGQTAVACVPLASTGTLNPFQQLILLAGLAAFCQSLDQDLAWERPAPQPQVAPDSRFRPSYHPRTA